MWRKCWHAARFGAAGCIRSRRDALDGVRVFICHHAAAGRRVSRKAHEARRKPAKYVSWARTLAGAAGDGHAMRRLHVAELLVRCWPQISGHELCSIHYSGVFLACFVGFARDSCSGCGVAGPRRLNYISWARTPAGARQRRARHRARCIWRKCRQVARLKSRVTSFARYIIRGFLGVLRALSERSLG